MGVRKALWASGPSSNNAVRAKGHEERIAERLGGKRVKRSGGAPATPRDRTTAWTKAQGIKTVTQGADIDTPDLRIEHKNTIAQSLSIRYSWLEQVTVSAKRHGKQPALVVTFDRGSQPEDWILLPLKVFEAYRRMARGE